MKKVMTCFMACLSGTIASAQLVNNGATIKIGAGATVFVSGHVDNKNGGTINNDGRLEVQGDFINTAIYTTATADDSLILSGPANASLNGGASVINNLHINKSSNSNVVTLTGSTSIGSKLVYQTGTLSTDPSSAFTLNANVSVPFEFTAGREIIGRVRRTGWSNGAARVFNQPNMLITTANGSAPSELTVNMVPLSVGGNPSLDEREVKRNFSFSTVGGSGFLADIRFPYSDDELNTNNESKIIPWQLLSNEWNGRFTSVTRDVVNNYVSSTGIPAAELLNEWKLADPAYTMNASVVLRGAWNGTTMNTSLRNASVIPLSQPYNTTPFNYSGSESVASIPANVVDWVLVEFRKPVSGQPTDALSATIIGRKAGFLLSNGNIVETDGSTPLVVDINKQGAGFMVLRHRNHIGVMSNSIPSNATGFYNNDFRFLANVYKPNGAPSDPMVLLPGSTQYGLWSGDANKNGVVNATDISAIRLGIASSLTGYQLTDVNLSNSINATDISLTRTTIAASGSGGTPGRTNIIIQTNIPDLISGD